MAGLAARQYGQHFDDSYESESNVVLDAPTFRRVATDEEADAAFAYVISKHRKALEMLAEYDRS